MSTISVILGVFVFWDLFFDYWLLYSDSLNTPLYGMNRSHNRFGSFFLNPNYLGAFVVLLFPAAFVITLNEKTKGLKLAAASGLLALVFCLVETQSRGPLLAFGVSILLLVLGPAGGITRARRLGVLFAFVAVFSILMPGFYSHAIGRFDEIEQEMTTDSARTRETIWKYTKRAIADHPVAGIGFGEKQFLSVMDDYGFRDEYGEESLDNPHNSYLSDDGIRRLSGAPLLSARQFPCAAQGRIVGAGAKSESGPIAFGLSVGLAGFLMVIYPDMHMFTQTVAPVYWVFFGLLLSLVTADASPAAAIAPVPVVASEAVGRPCAVPLEERHNGRDGNWFPIDPVREASMRIVILTSETSANTWLVNQILAQHDVSGIVIERRPPALSAGDKVERRRRMIRRYGLLRTVNKLLFNRVRSRFLADRDAGAIKDSFFPAVRLWLTRATCPRWSLATSMLPSASLSSASSRPK